MQYRRLLQSDLTQAQAFVTEGLRAERYPTLLVSPARISALLEQFLGSFQHYHMVAVDGPAIVGGLGALTLDSPFFERSETHVVMCRAIAPGVGRHLIEAYRNWVDDMPFIRRAFFPMECDARPGMARLLRRYGFTTTVPVGVFYKG